MGADPAVRQVSVDVGVELRACPNLDQADGNIQKAGDDKGLRCLAKRPSFGEIDTSDKVGNSPGEELIGLTAQEVRHGEGIGDGREHG